MIKRLREIIREKELKPAAPVQDLVIAVGPDLEDPQILEEGKWISVEFEDDIRLDRNTHLQSDELHAHFHDRKGNEIYSMKADGTRSHNSKSFKLTKDQASALAAQGFTIPKNRIVEGVLIGSGRILLLG